MTEFWNVALHVVPVLIGLFLATVKLADVIKSAIHSEVKPVAARLDKIEERFLAAMRDVWEHNASQDVKIDAVMVSHHRLAGAHDALTKIREHKSE